MANDIDRPIQIVLINGSVRPNNYTSMASALVVDELGQHPKITVEVIHPAELNLAPPGMDIGTPGARRLQEAVKGAAGVVFATPEYHGSFSSVTKLVIENLGFPSVLAGKPIALLGVAMGAIGAIKSLEHLRSVVSHVGGFALPNLISVANVQQQFDKEGRCTNPVVEKQIRSVATVLIQYLEQSVCPRVTLEAMLRGEARGTSA